MNLEVKEGETNTRGNSRNHRRVYQEITPELLESMGFARNGGGTRNPNVVLKPNITVATQLPLGKPYSGGSGLKQFEKAFRTIATHNGWPDVVAAVNLKDNLNGAAKVVVSNLEADDDDYEPTVDEIFLALRNEFGGTEAKLDAKAKYLKISQRPSESVANFTTRFQSARIKAGKADDEEAAMQFWGALTTVGNTPYDSDRFVNVETVARIMKGMDTSAKLRSKRKADVIDECDDGDQGKSASKLAQILKRKQQGRPLQEEEDSDDGMFMTKSSDDDELENGKITAIVRQLGANMDNIYQRGRGDKSRGADVKHQRGDYGQPKDRNHDLAEPRHGGRQSGSRSSAPCPLCGGTDHLVDKCPELCCSNCGEMGHTKKSCQRDARCAKCGKTNHTTLQCWRDKTCLKCGMRGHIAERCRTFLSSREEIKPRPQDQRTDYRPARDDRSCYRCGRQGHIARDCHQDQRKQPPATGANRMELHGQERQHRRDDNQDRERVPMKKENKRGREGEEQGDRRPEEEQGN